MSRESCIAHRPKQALAIVRQDYYELTGRDACAAALLNIFEYWANAALVNDPIVERPWVGERPIREFEQLLLGIATDKQIRKRLMQLEELGWIETRAPAKRGAAKAYRVLLPELQQALVAQMTNEERLLGSNNRPPFGQMTDEAYTARSNDPLPLGQTTKAPLVKQPTPLRSNDRALKKISLEFKKESSEEVLFSSSDSNLASPERASPVAGLPIQVDSVAYAQPPETIDLSELWAQNPGIAKHQVRLLAPGHKRPEMVAQGVGHWWIGPGLNDFDEHLIQACQNRKRKFQQSDSVGDAKTFINNMIRNGDWANFALRCDEALLLRERAAVLPVSRAVEPSASGRSPFERSPAERSESALGLARFKVSQGLMDQAWAIAQQFGLTTAEVGLINEKSMPILMLNAA
jgi:hypothetical protein